MQKPRFLVVDGYAREGREELGAGGATAAGELYRRMLDKCTPGGAEIEVVHPADPGAALPAGAVIADYDGIAWTGSSLTIFSDDPRVRSQIDFTRAVYESRVPSFGSCWAAQIAAIAAGGRCGANPKGREIGIARKIALTPEGRAHPLYRGKKSVFDGWISHDDEVTHLPPTGVLLASNRWTHVQALAVTSQGGVFWGLQYHPEFDAHEMARLCFCRKQKLTDLGFFRDLDAAQAFVEQLELLHRYPGRKDIAWLLGIDEDLLDEDIRQAEVRNWIEQLVLPSMGR